MDLTICCCSDAYKLTTLSWNVHPPQFDEDNVYFATKYSLYSINKETGAKNWENELYWDFQGSNYLLYQDKLITNLDNGDLIALDKNTGEIAWVQESLSGCCTDLYIYGDKLYFGNGDLFIVDPLTGDLLWQYTTSTEKEKGRGLADFKAGVTVDLDNNRIYITDGYYLLCLQHPEL